MNRKRGIILLSVIFIVALVVSIFSIGTVSAADSKKISVISGLFSGNTNLTITATDEGLAIRPTGVTSNKREAYTSYSNKLYVANGFEATVDVKNVTFDTLTFSFAVGGMTYSDDLDEGKLPYTTDVTTDVAVDVKTNGKGEYKLAYDGSTFTVKKGSADVATVVASDALKDSKVALLKISLGGINKLFTNFDADNNGKNDWNENDISSVIVKSIGGQSFVGTLKNADDSASGYLVDDTSAPVLVIPENINRGVANFNYVSVDPEIVEYNINIPLGISAYDVAGGTKTYAMKIKYFEDNSFVGYTAEQWKEVAASSDLTKKSSFSLSVKDLTGYYAIVSLSVSDGVNSTELVAGSEGYTQPIIYKIISKDHKIYSLDEEGTSNNKESVPEDVAYSKGLVFNYSNYRNRYSSIVSSQVGGNDLSVAFIRPRLFVPTKSYSKTVNYKDMYEEIINDMGTLYDVCEILGVDEAGNFVFQNNPAALSYTVYSGTATTSFDGLSAGNGLVFTTGSTGPYFFWIIVKSAETSIGSDELTGGVSFDQADDCEFYTLFSALIQNGYAKESVASGTFNSKVINAYDSVTSTTRVYQVNNTATAKAVYNSNEFTVTVDENGNVIIKQEGIDTKAFESDKDLYQVDKNGNYVFKRLKDEDGKDAYRKAYVHVMAVGEDEELGTDDDEFQFLTKEYVESKGIAFPKDGIEYDENGDVAVIYWSNNGGFYYDDDDYVLDIDGHLCYAYEYVDVSGAKKVKIDTTKVYELYELDSVWHKMPAYTDEKELKSVASSATFTPQNVGVYKVVYNAKYGDKEVSIESYFSVIETPAAAASSFFELNTLSIVCLCVAAVAALGIIALLVIKPKKD